MAMRSFVLAGMLCLAAPMALACSQPAGAAGLEAQMIQWINAQRQANGLAALRAEARLGQAAQGHACDMAVRGYFGHQRAGGPDFSARVKATGYRFRTAAENIAKVGAPDVSRATTVWRDSAGHWRNILNPQVSEIGVGVATAGGQVYWVMNVGKPR